MEHTPNSSPEQTSFNETQLKLKEQELKVEELTLKVADLKRPAYKKLNFWTSSLAVVIALGGVIGQNIISNIQSKTAALEMKEAQVKKDSALKVVTAAELAVDVAKSKQLAAQQELAAIQLQKDSAEKSIALIRAQIYSMPSSTGRTDSIKTLLNKATAQLNNIAPRVYIQIADESQRSAAKLLQNELNKRNFIAPGVENVARLNANIPDKMEVRYYRDEERGEAAEIIQILKTLNLGQDLNETPVRIPGNGRGTRPRHYEVWFTNP
jgi:predicted nucleic acid-binding protein